MNLDVLAFFYKAKDYQQKSSRKNHHLLKLLLSHTETLHWWSKWASWTVFWSSSSSLQIKTFFRILDLLDKLMKAIKFLPRKMYTDPKSCIQLQEVSHMASKAYTRAKNLCLHFSEWLLRILKMNKVVSRRKFKYASNFCWNNIQQLFYRHNTSVVNFLLLFDR